jgi:hypothetical protein
MKNSRFVLKWTAVLLVIAVTICSLLLSLRVKSAGQADLNTLSQPRYVTMPDRPRSEIRIERLLDLENPHDFDPDLTSLLKRERERQRGTANQNATSYEQVASVSHDQKGARQQ